jgi:transposase
MNKFDADGIYNRCFMLDNVQFHRMATIRELILSQNHESLFLPPYSPQLNPIEDVFSKWKGLIKDANCNTQDQ